MSAATFVSRHSQIIGALLMRELTTRFGREGLGFAWVIGEPLLFCFGVLLLWSVLKPEYEHGIRIGPFVMTGYMSILLLRHQVSFSMGALQSNVGLLHHRQIHVLHLYITRNLLEFLGATAAFVLVYSVLLVLGEVSLPPNVLLLYGGWFLMAWMGMGLGLVFAGLSLRFEIMERLVPVLTYALVPISGSFFMVAWLPPQVREYYLLIPIPHAIEMVRASVFGEFVPTYFDPVYALVWGGVLNMFGLLLLSDAKNRIDVE